jgi:molybdopterin synthase sulfur carrier subunit
MHVRVRLFATLARFSTGSLPGTPFDLDIPDHAPICDLMKMLQIPQEETKITFVNGLIHDLDWKLNPDDEVGIFPPIAGG